MATVTTDLKLNKSELTDNVSPIPMNENMDKIDDLLGKCICIVSFDSETGALVTETVLQSVQSS